MSLFVVQMSLFVASAALGEVQVALFVAGAVLGEVQVFLFVAGAAHGAILVLCFLGLYTHTHKTGYSEGVKCCRQVDIFH